MDAHVFLIQIVLILVFARILGEAAAYFNIPAVIGELLAGIIIGPSLFGLVAMSEPLYLLAEIGVILLLFEVGLETDFKLLIAKGRDATIVAFGGVMLPLAGAFILSSYIFGFSNLISLFIASTLTATSIGITMRVLKDLKQEEARETKVIIGAAILDDIIGIILLSMLYEFSKTGQFNFMDAGKFIIFIMVFFLLAPFAAKIVSEAIRKWDQKSDIPGLLPTMIVSLILLFAWIAHKFGAPELLGGFAAGLALSKHFIFPFVARSHDFSHKVEETMKPIVHLFSPIFFVSIGLSLNLRTIDWGSSFVWVLTASLLIVAILGKLASGFFLLKEDFKTKMIIGTAMVPRGEVGLIFANVGLTLGVFKDDIYASLILVVTITTLLAPFVLRSIFAKNGQAEKSF